MNPRGLKKDEYDVIIIGAGIGGLVCGCYLTKAGMKVLIVEQHYQPGGYCQSFSRNGFVFDAGPHALGSLRDGGQLGIVFKDLELDKKIKVIRRNPSDLIAVHNCKINIRNNLEDIISDFQQKFPHESDGIKSFFEFIDKVEVASFDSLVFLYKKLKGKPFSDLLDYYFRDNKLKAILTIPLAALTLPSTMASAMTTCIHYKEFILDGGYYPVGGMQRFVDALAKIFKDNGGNLALSHLVDKIYVQDNKVKGINIKDRFIKSKYVVSNCDVRQTFLSLIGRDYFKKDFIAKLDNLVTSGSGFCIYLGLNKKISAKLNLCSTNWFFSDYNVDKFYGGIFTNSKYNDSNFVLMFPSLHDNKLVSGNSETARLFVSASFDDNIYIEKNKHLLAGNLIKKVEKIIPGFSKSIVIKEEATPYTFYKYTLNGRGCIRGLAALPSQDGLFVMPSKTPIENLFLASHWTTDPGQGGIAVVAYSGRHVSNLILKKQ